MFQLVQSRSSRLAGARADDRVLLALSGAEGWQGEARVRGCLEQLRAMLIARRRVELCYGRAVAAGRGRGGSEGAVRARLRAGLSRRRQLVVLAEDHEAAMVHALGVHEAFLGAWGRVRRTAGLPQRVPGLLSLCEAEERAWSELMERYPEQRLHLRGLVARWQTLSPG